MTLAEYKTQDPVQRLPVGSVLLAPEDYLILSTYKEFKWVRVSGYPYSYVVDTSHGGTLLFTTDEHGNQKRASVFALASAHIVN